MSASDALDRQRDYWITAATVVKVELTQAEQEARERGDDAIADQLAARRAAVAKFRDDLLGLDTEKLTKQKLAKWIALVRAHRKTGKARPSLLEVAEMMGWNSEQPLRTYVHDDLGVASWHDVHPIVAAAPEKL